VLSRINPIFLNVPNLLQNYQNKYFDKIGLSRLNPNFVQAKTKQTHTPPKRPVRAHIGSSSLNPTKPGKIGLSQRVSG